MQLSDWSIRAGRLIAGALEQLLGAPASLDARLVFAVQAALETANGASIGATANNPLNLTTARGRIFWPGQVGTYSGGSQSEWHGDFARFARLEHGAYACALNYASGGAYQAVRDAFRHGNPLALAAAIEASPWDSGHYGNGNLAAAVQTVIAALQEDDDMTPEQLKAILDKDDALSDSIEIFFARLQRGLDVVTGKPLDTTDKTDPAPQVLALRAGPQG